MASEWSICRIRNSSPTVFEIVEVAVERLIHPLRLIEPRALRFLIVGAGLSEAEARARLADANDIPCPREPLNFVVKMDDETRAAIRGGGRDVRTAADSL